MSSSEVAIINYKSNCVLTVYDCFKVTGLLWADFKCGIIKLIQGSVLVNQNFHVCEIKCILTHLATYMKKHNYTK